MCFSHLGEKYSRKIPIRIKNPANTRISVLLKSVIAQKRSFRLRNIKCQMANTAQRILDAMSRAEN